VGARFIIAGAKGLCVWLGLGLFGLQAAPAPHAGVSPLINAFRVRITEVEQMEDPLAGGVPSMAGSTLVDMAKIDFIVDASRPIHPRYVHDYDRKFVLSAVRGQQHEELESHLPAVMNYVKLATTSRLYAARIRQQDLLWGEPRGLEKLQSIAKRAADFRNENVDLILAGKMRPSRVLTAEHLGELGRPELLAELEATYKDARDQFYAQRSLVVWMIFATQLAISLAVALFFLQRRKPHARFDMRG
jgi:hypothetical protein